MSGLINPDLSRIWDEADVYVILNADAPVGGISTLIPATVDAPIAADWEFVGLLDAAKGIPVTPAVEITHFNGFGHPRYRSKAKNGTLTTGFTAFEDNAVTRKLVLPGSTANKIGAPKNIRGYTLYVLRDEDIATDIRVSIRPCLFELASHSGAVEGAQEAYEITCHHANDENGDVFYRVEDGPVAKTVTFTGGPFTAGTFTLTVSGQTTAGIAYGATASAIKTALELLSTVGSGNAEVTGTVAGGLTITVPGVLSGTGSGLTPTGTIAVS